MITRENLQEAIQTCLEEKNPNAHTCLKLSAYYTILNNMEKDSPQNSISSQGDNEFARITREQSISRMMPVFEALMEELQITNPRLYDKVIRKLKG